VKDIKPLLKTSFAPDAAKQEFYAMRFEKYLKYYNMPAAAIRAEKA